VYRLLGTDTVIRVDVVRAMFGSRKVLISSGNEER